MLPFSPSHSSASLCGAASIEQEVLLSARISALRGSARHPSFQLPAPPLSGGPLSRQPKFCSHPTTWGPRCALIGIDAGHSYTGLQHITPTSFCAPERLTKVYSDISPISPGHVCRRRADTIPCSSLHGRDRTAEGQSSSGMHSKDDRCKARLRTFMSCDYRSVHAQDAWNTKNPEKVSLAYTPGEQLQDDVATACSSPS